MIAKTDPVQFTDSVLISTGPQLGPDPLIWNGLLSVHQQCVNKVELMFSSSNPNDVFFWNLPRKREAFILKASIDTGSHQKDSFSLNMSRASGNVNRSQQSGDGAVCGVM